MRDNIDFNFPGSSTRGRPTVHLHVYRSIKRRRNQRREHNDLLMLHKTQSGERRRINNSHDLLGSTWRPRRSTNAPYIVMMLSHPTRWRAAGQKLPEFLFHFGSTPIHLGSTPMAFRCHVSITSIPLRCDLDFISN